MNRNLLIIGGGLLQVPVIQTARTMNLKTIVADMNPDSLGFRIADYKIVMSTKDVEGMVREAKKFSEKVEIHGVMTAGTDASMTVAAVANALNLPGIRYVDAEAASNKIKMRKRLKEHQVPIPNFHPVWSIQDARDALEFLKFPMVMKPADNMGARGVIKVANREELQSAFKHSKKYCPTGEMILEEYMEGPELSVDALAWDGNFVMTGIADRIIEREPYFIEMGHNMPSSLPNSVLLEVEKVMVQGMKALGIHLGAGKGDIKVTKDGVKVGEIAARLSGGFMSSFTYPLSTGINLNRAAILLALGEKPDNLVPVLQKVSIERSLIAPAGKLIEISGVEEVKRLDGVNEIFLQNKVGDMIKEPTNNIEKTGHIIITANSLPEAEKIFSQSLDIIRFRSDEIYSINEKEMQQNARQKFGKDVCWVCKVCDGKDCASGVPGMGGVGKMYSFQDNWSALREYSILPSYIREPVVVNTSFSLLGVDLKFPVMTAPLTGVETNMNHFTGEFEFADILLHGSSQAGTISWTGDGASPDKYKTILEAVKKNAGKTILICKPRAEDDKIIERIRAAEDVGVIGIGMDIDAVSFKTMQLKKQSTTTRNFSQIEKLRKETKLPFFIKGIMSAEDAKNALKAGVSGIVVSNHGGRVLDDMPGSARVLPEISEIVKGKAMLLSDGGIRSGMDVFKMIALGADAVLIGRPVAIAACGAESIGVTYYLNQIYQELIQTMGICGTEKLKDISKKNIFKK